MHPDKRDSTGDYFDRFFFFMLISKTQEEEECY